MKEPLLVLGTLGDINPIEYGGGYLYNNHYGALEWLYIEPPCDERARVIMAGMNSTRIRFA